jgi:hypothetical protein
LEIDQEHVGRHGTERGASWIAGPSAHGDDVRPIAAVTADRQTRQRRRLSNSLKLCDRLSADAMRSVGDALATIREPSATAAASVGDAVSICSLFV